MILKTLILFLMKFGSLLPMILALQRRGLFKNGKVEAKTHRAIAPDCMGSNEL
jgi:hypothetical protein